VSARGKKTTGPGGARSRIDLRIIAGRWRGRRWRFVAAPGVRPTPNRVRETLFNWLAPRIVGARCLDLFAGSGALGLEALSRGASEVWFIDHEREVTAALRALLEEWQATGAQVINADAVAWLRHTPPRPFDMVFLDPPFASEQLGAILALLRSGGWLASGAWVYLEQPAATALPAGWQVHRSGRAGAVGYHLIL
jgi:16S rRNA (guanine966-N2)-methyltransferase